MGVVAWIEAHGQFIMLVAGLLMTVSSGFVAAAVAKAKPTMAALVDEKLGQHEQKEFSNHAMIENRLHSFENRLDTVSAEVSRMGGYLEAIAVNNGNPKNRRRYEDVPSDTQRD